MPVTPKYRESVRKEKKKKNLQPVLQTRQHYTIYLYIYHKYLGDTGETVHDPIQDAVCPPPTRRKKERTETIAL